ncbi:MAG: T9SS type A sorting domain-containing protein, partial [Chitinophagales bacterium]
EGLLQWQRSLGGSGEDFGRIAFELPDGAYMIGGRTNSPNDGDVKDNHGDYDYWLVKLKSDGTSIIWKRCFGGSLGEGAPPSTVPFMNVIATPEGYFAMAGATFSTDGDAVGNISSGPNDDNYWIVNFADSSSLPTGNANEMNDPTINISVYPDPVKDVLTVSFPSLQIEVTVSLFSLEGRLLLTKRQEQTNNLQLMLSTFSTGMYLLKIIDEDGLVTQKKIIKI